MSKKTAPTVADYENAIDKVLDENEALQAKLAEAEGRLNALMTAFDERGSLGILQQIAHDKRLPPETRIRAAGLAVPFERPKLALTATATVPLYDLLQERRRQGKLIGASARAGPSGLSNAHTPFPPGSEIFAAET